MDKNKAQRWTSAPRLLDQLAHLTSIRDLELMETSLLKTLSDFIHPQSLRLVRLDTKGEPTMDIVFGRDRCISHYEAVPISETLRQAHERLSHSDTPHFLSTAPSGVHEVFALASTRAGRSYLEFTRATALSKFDHHLMSGFLQIYRNFFGLMQHSQTDQLTGLANRKTFDDCVAKVEELIPFEGDPVVPERRISAPLHYWLVMVDIDHFKSVNDRFGHLYGDEVLVLLAQQMKASFREDDLIFRFGGEEFVLIIRCADQATCRSTLERFRQQVEHRHIPQVGHITVSLGATRMTRGTFAATMIDYADKAMYHSKHNGRNQVTFFEDLVTQGLASEEEFKAAAISFF